MCCLVYYATLVMQMLSVLSSVLSPLIIFESKWIGWVNPSVVTNPANTHTVRSSVLFLMCSATLVVVTNCADRCVFRVGTCVPAKTAHSLNVQSAARMSLNTSL